MVIHPSSKRSEVLEVEQRTTLHENKISRSLFRSPVELNRTNLKISGIPQRTSNLPLDRRRVPMIEEELGSEPAPTHLFSIRCLEVLLIPLFAAENPTI
jgi:hypothetical protein